MILAAPSPFAFPDATGARIDLAACRDVVAVNPAKGPIRTLRDGFVRAWAILAKGASPADVAKLAPEERAKKVEEWTADARKHWSVQGGELVNDGKGA